MKSFLTGLVLLFASVAQSQTYIVHFDFNKSDLKEHERILIDSFFAVQRDKLATGKIELAGYCDYIGSDQYNDGLSLRRVTTVKNYLEKMSLSPEIITSVKAYGERDPLNENKTDEDRMLNRRVEIRIVSASAEQALPEKPSQSLSQKIADTSTKRGTQIVLKNINFVGGRHQFLEEAYPALQELLEAMKTYPTLIIEIRGHVCCLPTDDDGPDLDTHTNNLSQERARAVYYYLIDNGINKERLSYRGFGHSMPLYAYPEQTEEERIENRRVEIKIISK